MFFLDAVLTRQPCRTDPSHESSAPAADPCWPRPEPPRERGHDVHRLAAALCVPPRQLVDDGIVSLEWDGYGILGGWHSMRHMANLESVYTYEGTHDMHTLIIGQAVTGVAEYR